MSRRVGIVFLAAIALLLLTSCSDFVDQDQLRVSPEASVTLVPGHPLGQTFVARHAGLSGVEIWLEPGPDSQGEVRLYLQANPGAADDLATARLPLSQVSNPGFYRFAFTPLSHSHGRYLYAFLGLQGEGSVQVGAGPGDSYLDGALYRDHQPLDVQMAFQLVYDPMQMILDLGRAAVGGLGLLGVAGLLYVVPGWALLVWLWPGERLSWAERLCIAVGLSLALYPLLMLWADLVGLHLGPLYAWLPVVGGLAALVWRYRAWQPRKGWEALWQWMHSAAFRPDMALLAVMGLVFAVRLLVVRSLDAPMWGDSYQHTMIAQLLVDNGGLFDSWEPYAALQSFTYHFGFHAAMAVSHWVTGMEMTQAVLWGAQILNALAVLALYPLAVRVSSNRWAGVGAVLVAGLLSPMPMYYVNWGRYTQLAGQLILPTAVVISWSLFEAPRRQSRLTILSCIAVAGLALTHYRVLIFYVFFVLAWVLLNTSTTNWQQNLSHVASTGMGAGMLFLPWFVHTFAGKIVRNVGQQLTTRPEQLSSFARQYSAIRDPTFYLIPLGWLILTMALAVGLWRRRHKVLLMGLWWFLMLIATNPHWLGLPGSGVISNPALFMAVYILAGVLIGDLMASLPTGLSRWRWVNVLAALLATVLGLWGMRARMGDVLAPQHAMVTRPDMQAMAWIRENTPEDAKFLINSFFAYGGSVIVGSDGGWWLPLLGERSNTVPPLNYAIEQGPRPEHREWINDLSRQIQGAQIDSPATLALLQEQGITHIYIGQRQGRVNYAGPNVLDPEALFHSDKYQLIYHQDRVWVFKVKRSVSTSSRLLQEQERTLFKRLHLF
jgi:hypothetical protein